MERDEALSLLREQHSFPGTFQFRVVIDPPAQSAVLSAMSAAAGEGRRVLTVGSRASSQGTYLALRVEMHLLDAEDVLAVYAILKDVPGVRTAL